MDVPEDQAVGTTILRNIEVEDRDSVGDSLEVGCVVNEQVTLMIIFTKPMINRQSPKLRRFLAIMLSSLYSVRLVIITKSSKP